MDVQRQSGFVGELLQLKLPQPHPHAIGAAAIGRDRQFAHIGIALASHRRTPVTDRLDRKLGSVAGDADADPTFIGAHIVNPVGHRLAQLLIGKIVHIDALWRAFWTPVGAGVLEVAEQLFLLGIDRDHRLPGSLRSQYLRVDVLELRIAVGVMRTLIGLAVGLPAKAQLRQQPLDAAGADGVTEAAQRSTKLLAALRHPQQGPRRRAKRGRSTSRRRSSSRVSSVSVSGRRPPPFWRTCPVGSAGASSSLSPCPMVESASPVISATAALPPQPAARASAAPNSRWPRSSSFEPTSSQRSRIPCLSIIPTRILLPRGARNLTAPSHISTGSSINRFSYSDGRP